MIKKIYLKDCDKWMISGFLDNFQEGNIIKTGFRNRVLKVFESEREADLYLRGIK